MTLRAGAPVQARREPVVRVEGRDHARLVALRGELGRERFDVARDPPGIRP